MRGSPDGGKTGRVADVEERKRPGMAFAGFATPFAVLVAVVAVAYSADLGWHGGEYAHAFLGIAAGSVVAGLVLQVFDRPWSSVGVGMMLAGAFCVVAAVAFVVLFLVAFSQWSPSP